MSNLNFTLELYDHLIYAKWRDETSLYLCMNEQTTEGAILLLHHALLSLVARNEIPNFYVAIKDDKGFIVARPYSMHMQDLNTATCLNERMSHEEFADMVSYAELMV